MSDIGKKNYKGFSSIATITVLEKSPDPSFLFLLFQCHMSYTMYNIILFIICIIFVILKLNVLFYTGRILLRFRQRTIAMLSSSLLPFSQLLDGPCAGRLKFNGN